MSRAAYHYLVQWLHSADRKPVVIRGARQVGKTWLVRELAKQQNKQWPTFEYTI
jgi:predicted AAA+ superfamily ATPase